MSQTNFGYVRVAAAVPMVHVANCQANAKEIFKLITDAEKQNVQIICFPELSITGYTCADLFHNQSLITEAENALEWLLEKTRDLNIVSIVGLPVRCGNSLFNAAVVIKNGDFLGVNAKTWLPNYNEFYEHRWFASAVSATRSEITLCGCSNVPFGRNLIFNGGEFSFAIEICEDLWTPIPPSSVEALAGAHLIFNLSASDEVLGKNRYLRNLIEQQSARCIAGYIYASSGFGESSTDLCFSGNAYVAENGQIVAESERFKMSQQLVITDVDIEKLIADRQKNSTFMTGAGVVRSELYRVIEFYFRKNNTEHLLRKIDAHPFVPSVDSDRKQNCQEIFNIQTTSLAHRLQHIGCKQAVIGISGGLDSTLALLVTAKTFDKLGIKRQNIIGITMPGFGTTNRTYNNALAMMRALGVDVREISIKAACEQHFTDIGHDINQHDVTYENSQARERTQILMDVANKENAIVIGTGDLSELALGWCTYNGDHMSMYAVNAGVPKTLVKYLVQYVADFEIDADAKPYLYDVIDTPISPELLPADSNGNIAQKTEDLVGPYELHDFFLYHFVRNGFAPSKIFYLAQNAFANIYTDEVIRKWLKTFIRRFFTQQFKRSCMPDGPKVGSVALSPRGDWRMPSDADFTEWMKE